jgi:putative endonuclease
MRRSCPIGIPRGKTVDCNRSGVRKLLFQLCYFAYILKSVKDGGFYYGHCKDIEKRLRNHNAGKVRSTKSRRPFIIHYTENYPTKSEAAKREYFFKTIEGYNFLKSSDII